MADTTPSTTALHYCHAHACTRACKPEYLMCRKHWNQVPHVNKVLVLSTYRPGQCEDKRPSNKWIIAANLAIAEVARMEGYPAEAQAYIMKAQWAIQRSKMN